MMTREKVIEQLQELERNQTMSTPQWAAVKQAISFLSAAETLQSASLKVLIENTRLRGALDFYARHEHWMSTRENHEPQMLLIAHRGDSVHIHGWDVAQRTIEVNEARLVKAALDEITTSFSDETP